MGGFTAITDPRSYLAGRLRDGAGGLVAAVDGVQLYGLPRPTEATEVERATAQVVHVMADALLDRTGLTGPAERSLRRLGTRRARQGIPLGHVKMAFRRATTAGLQVMKDAAVEWPDSCAAWDAFTELAGQLLLLVQEATDAVRDGYDEWMQGNAAGRARENVLVVEDLFEGSWATAEEMIDSARAIGSPMTDRCLLLSVLALDSPYARDLRDGVLELATVEPHGVIVGLIRGSPVHHVPCIVPLTGDGTAEVIRRRIDKWARRTGVVAVVEAVDNIVLVPVVYQQMRDELDLVVAVVNTPGAVESGRALHLARLLKTVRQESVEAFIRPALGGVLAQPPSTAERLLETLGALFSREGSMNRLATSLALSHSGLRTRLSRVRELTARHHNRDRVELVLALLLFRIHRLRLPPVGDARWST
jgi:hypothetical protein